MMGEEAPETCWATHKRQVINLWNCRILLVNLFESKDKIFGNPLVFRLQLIVFSVYK